MRYFIALLAPVLLSSVEPGSTVSAIDVPLTVVNREAAAIAGAPITTGVPFARGVLRDSQQVRITRSGSEIPSQFLPTAYWPDGSIRWLLVDFQTDLTASGSSQVTLQTGVAPSAVAGITIDDRAETLTVNTRATTFSFSKSAFLVGGNEFRVTSGGHTYRAVPASGAWFVEERGAMKVVVRVEGNWYEGSSILRDSLIRFRARLFFYRDKSDIRLQLTFRNNSSFGWDGISGQPDLHLTGATFGIPLLPPGGDYVFGSGVEKTWEVIAPLSGSLTLRESRYNADGTLAANFTAPAPLAVASPQYYASTRAWGRVALPLTGLPADRQPDFDRFEKFQRALVTNNDLENPPGRTGITLWGHLSTDLASWHDYGDQRWAGDFGDLSGNHYDWSYGMYLQFFRTGRLAFLDMARVLARHEIDFDIYHTNADGTAYNYQKNWESRPSHDNPDNGFGPGRPSHTWSQGYALHWLLTGDPRGRDGYQEILEGVRQYVYESFNGEGYIDTSEIRIAGWLAENLITLWRINPSATLETTDYGSKSIPDALKDVLRAVFDREAAAGGNGYVYSGDPPDPNLRQPLMNLYFLEPAIKAYEEVFQERDPSYATGLLGLIRRMTGWLISVTYGGNSRSDGLYRPRQIPYMVDVRLSSQVEGQIPYVWMAANAAGFCYLSTRDMSYLSYARAAFQDYSRYFGITGGDAYIDSNLRTPTAYNSSVYSGTESKVHGWCVRYGQYFFDAERTFGDSSAERLAIGLGRFNASGGWVSTHGGAGANFISKSWTQLPWAAYNATGGETHVSVGDVDGDGLGELILGLGRGGGGWIAVLDDAVHGYALLQWVRVNWPDYNSANGEVFPAAGDLDGDGRAEIVAGLGAGSQGWIQIMDDAASSFQHLAWRQVAYASYNAANGTTHPAAADLDGDGKAEIVLGLGNGGGGWMEVINSAGGNYSHRAWIQVNYPSYCSSNGSTFPASGDTDGDGRAEIVVGLGQGGGGWVEILDDMAAGYALLRWHQTPWAAYNSSVGETHPAMGDLDGDSRAEIAFGLGRYSGAGGWLYVLDDSASGYALQGWLQISWNSFVADGGETFPAIGRLR